MTCYDCWREPCECPETLYRQEMGQEPPSLLEGDPLAWQWDTSLSRRERRARLLADLGQQEEAEGPPPVIPGQESLL